MKTSMMLAFSMFCLSLTNVTYAEQDVKKIVRNDRVTVVKHQIPQFDINPFVDSKRIARTDRVGYVLPKTEAEASPKKTRITRNDRIVIQKPVI
ncbi:hypothetical protein [Acinetobacter sp. DSM 11652]|uniref:hypothetical protein n=1 Tax=Acinetobacter sp. DSM 11652 TaxID=346222 RepID=UPI0008D6EEB4|nr:hypothetical protein [Acinetobacter sp. DSM 11652]SEL63445.1 hypothetical protein SAMN05216500_10418 [Acinetobacter sp. DSM 11652]